MHVIQDYTHEHLARSICRPEPLPTHKRATKTSGNAGRALRFAVYLTVAASLFVGKAHARSVIELICV